MDQSSLAESSSNIKYGGYTRFEVECEFVSCLANPHYLQHLATQKFFDDPRFVAYLDYLQYWKEPPYLKYLIWPGPTLKHLELLQDEKFRRDIISPDIVRRLEEDGMRAAVEWHKPSAGANKPSMSTSSPN
jgi:mediator of RNA polymerase II transcription subunit 31